MPKVGPMLGWRMAMTTRLPRCLKAWAMIRDFLNGPQLRGLGNLQVRRHGFPSV